MINKVLHLKSWSGPTFCLMVIALIVLGVQTGVAAQFQISPSLSVRYTSHTNLNFGNEGNYEPLDSTYMNYILGLSMSYTQSRHRISLSGHVSYEQMMDFSGPDYADDLDPADFNYTRIGATLAYTYSVGQKFRFEIKDTITQSRDLQEIFGEGADSLQYVYLYANNAANVNVRFSFTKKSRLYVGYTYTSLIFDEPPNDLNIVKPPNSPEHRGSVRGEYDFTGKTTGIADVQYATREYEDLDNMNVASYNLLQGLLGLRYHFTGQNYVELMGGAVQRTFDNWADNELPSPPYGANELMYDIQDTTDAVGTLIWVYNENSMYSLRLMADQGISTYGVNLYFTYTGASAKLTYFINPKMNLAFSCRYQHAVFDLEKNGREWMWDEDRIDDVIVASANFNWDLIQRDRVGTVSFQAGYNWRDRNSSIDDIEDWNPIYATVASPVALRGYDATVQLWFVQLTFTPTYTFNQ